MSAWDRVRGCYRKAAGRASRTRRRPGRCRPNDFDVKEPNLSVGESTVLAHVYIGAGKVQTFSQERLSQYFGEGVGKAVSEVQTRRVAPFAIVAPGCASNLNLLRVSRNDLETCSAQEQIKLPASGFATPGFQHDASFKGVHGRDEAFLSLADLSQELLPFRFCQKDRQQG
jgi:hypothetical protein